MTKQRHERLLFSAVREHLEVLNLIKLGLSFFFPLEVVQNEWVEHTPPMCSMAGVWTEPCEKAISPERNLLMM